MVALSCKLDSLNDFTLGQLIETGHALC